MRPRGETPWKGFARRGVKFCKPLFRNNLFSTQISSTLLRDALPCGSLRLSAGGARPGRRHLRRDLGPSQAVGADPLRVEDAALGRRAHLPLAARHGKRRRVRRLRLRSWGIGTRRKRCAGREVGISRKWSVLRRSETRNSSLVVTVTSRAKVRSVQGLETMPRPGRRARAHQTTQLPPRQSGRLGSPRPGFRMTYASSRKTTLRLKCGCRPWASTWLSKPQSEQRKRGRADSSAGAAAAIREPAVGVRQSLTKAPHVHHA